MFYINLRDYKRGRVVESETILKIEFLRVINLIFQNVLSHPRPLATLTTRSSHLQCIMFEVLLMYEK